MFTFRCIFSILSEAAGDDDGEIVTEEGPDGPVPVKKAKRVSQGFVISLLILPFYLANVSEMNWHG